MQQTAQFDYGFPHIHNHAIMVTAFLVENIDAGNWRDLYREKQKNAPKLTHRHTQNHTTWMHTETHTTPMHPTLHHPKEVELLPRTRERPLLFTQKIKT